MLNVIFYENFLNFLTCGYIHLLRKHDTTVYVYKKKNRIPYANMVVLFAAAMGLSRPTNPINPTQPNLDFMDWFG